VLDLLRSGAWLTPTRLRAYPLLLLVAFFLTFAVILAGSEGGRDQWGRPLGTDFLSLYAASSLALEGKAEAAYDPALHRQAEGRLLAARGGEPLYYAWHYPPLGLLLVAPLALLPYLPALAVWLGATLAAFWAMGRRILGGHRAMIAAAAFPALFINLLNGQSGFLVAALMAGALVMMERRPWLAGLCLGLLAFKPQFGLVIPLALLAGGQWRVFGAATLSTLGLAALSWLVLGGPAWQGFLASLSATQGVILEPGGIGFAKQLSFYGFFRHWGAGDGMAWLFQAGLSAAAALAVLRLWAGQGAFEDKAAGLVLGALLATPHLLDYDLTLLGIVLLFLARRGLREGFRPWEKSLLALLWLLPLLARPLALLGLPLVPLALGSLLVALLRVWRLPAPMIRV
jgi:alpha-1,2-mannosyltransferase